MSELLIYSTEDKDVGVRLEGETVWLTQDQMASLFERDRSVINRHLRNVFRDGELEQATRAFFAQVQTEGDRVVTRQVEHYNLDAIISVGYRVNSRRGVQFRQWATRVLREHLTQGLISFPRSCVGTLAMAYSVCIPTREHGNEMSAATRPLLEIRL